jgi:pyruvate/2-oxoglutarate dehydrogenase complex dihydrolipoamide acyltransferase (E2) component
VGESVTPNEPLVEITTDKVTVEIAAPATGILREILKPADQPIHILGLQNSLCIIRFAVPAP